jgi:hexosaminidase
MNLLYETIDAMMYNKLNVFHWHIVDEDSFPLELESHPEFAEYASFSIYEKYSLKEVR